MSRMLGWVALAALVAGSACEKSKGEQELIDKVMSAKGITSGPPPEATVTAFKKMPELTIDELGAYFGGKRADKLTKKEGRKKLDEIIKLLPVDDSPVTIDVAKKAKIPDVGVVVEAFGKAGAPKVILRTEGRADLPKELTVTPLMHVSEPPNCAVVASINEELLVAVWTLKGGGGGKYRKGWAGPDLTHASEGMEKRLERCDAEVAFFSANATLDWQMAFNVGGTLIKADPEGKKIKHLVLLGEEPVGGRKLELEFKK
jgi:biopolymer transport protein ExbD